MALLSRTVVLCLLAGVFAGTITEGRSPGTGAAGLGVSLSADSSSLHAGTAMTFTASVTGQSGAVEYAFWVFEGSAWHRGQGYGPASVFAWTPSAPGQAAVQVWVRHAGTTAAYEAWTGTGYITVAPPPALEPVALVHFSVDVGFPVRAGRPITWTALAIGTSPEFQFWRFDPSGWHIVQGYGPSGRYTWTPGANDVGIHALQVWVRSSGSSSAYDAWTGSGLFEILPAPAVTSVTLGVDRALPAEAFRTIVWAAAAGGRSDVEYQFWRFSRSAWQIVQDFGPAATYTWTPGALDVGTNAIQVWARGLGSSAYLEAWTGSGLFQVIEPVCTSQPDPGDVCHQPVPSYINRDYIADLQVTTTTEIADARRALTAWIWGHDELPPLTEPSADAVEIGITHPDIAALKLPNLLRVDRYRIDVEVPPAPGESEAPLRSYVYEFVPISANNRLLVYNQGHIRDPAHVFKTATMVGADTVLRAFLELGYTVLYIQMPLLGDNADPRFPVFAEENPHDLLGARKRPGYNPLKAFLHPIRVAIGYARNRRVFSDVSMTGVSGGGWATTVYAALDPGVTSSFPVAGSLPVTLNQGADDPCRHGLDWEQSQFPAPATDDDPEQPLGYLDLYLMASVPAGSDGPRQQIQILNRYDNCCFKGAKADGSYGEQLASFATGLGGTYQMAIDDTHYGHLISACALRAFVLPALGHGGS